MRKGRDTERFAQTISSLQEISESVRDIVMRAYVHVSNHHSGLLDSQIEELTRISRIAFEVLDRTLGDHVEQGGSRTMKLSPN